MAAESETSENPAVVLLVDDEPDLLELLEEFLQGQGYEVHLANGGDAGLRKIMEITPDAIVTDLVMPDVTGIEVLKTARLRHPDVSVMILTGFATLDSSIDAMDQGALGYMLKPVKRPEFTARIRDAIEQTKLRRERTSLMLELASTSFKLQAVFDAVEEGLILVGGDGRIENANPAAARLLGCETETLAGRTVDQALPPEAAELALAIAHVQRTGERTVLKDRRLSGPHVPSPPVTASVGSVEALDGPAGVLVTLTDLSTRR